MRRVAAFTLIELLVAIATIALLVAILLPALNSARQQARGLRCLAQIRELGRGMTLYHTENGNFPGHQWRLPIQPDGTQPRLRWFNAMAEYLAGDGQKQETMRLPKCPSTADWEVGRNNSYGYNYKYIGSLRDNQRPDNPWRPYEAFAVRELRAPATTIAFADCDGTGWTLPWGPERTPDHPDADQDPHRLGNHGYLLDPTYIPVWSVESYSGGDLEPYSWRGWRTYLSDRHGGKSQAVFTDGHGAPIDPRKAYADNAMWNGLGFEVGLGPECPAADLDPHVEYRYDASSGQEWRYGGATGVE